MPLLGLTASFVFAAQMLNFPVLAGTSGHLMGGTLVAILLGPAAAVLVLTSVLAVQAFVFADGGVFALGANVLTLGLISVMAGWGTFRLLRRVLPLPPDRSLVVAAVCGGWAGTVAAAAACAAMLALSGIVPWALAFPAMTGVHIVIGLGEGLITGAAAHAIARTQPELVELSGFTRGRLGLAALSATVLLVLVLPFASPWPDGLETVASRLGFEHLAGVATAAPLPDFLAPLAASAPLATMAAGAIGALLVFVVAYGLARLLAPSASTGAAHADAR
jgi:cobalt/nickel transport system permease protein